MELKSLGMKVSLIVALMIAVIVIVITVIVSTLSSEMINDLTVNDAHSANNMLAKEVDNLVHDAEVRARIIANSNDVIDSIIAGDANALKDMLIELCDEMDTATIVDAQGYVLIRMHNERRGDNIFGLKGVGDVLASGADSGIVVRDPGDWLATRGTAVIRDYDRNIIGAV